MGRFLGESSPGNLVSWKVKWMKMTLLLSLGPVSKTPLIAGIPGMKTMTTGTKKGLESAACCTGCQAGWITEVEARTCSRRGTEVALGLLVSPLMDVVGPRLRCLLRPCTGVLPQGKRGPYETCGRKRELPLFRGKGFLRPLLTCLILT
jgi:hypothetical protein